jgi:hypothetical protein
MAPGSFKLKIELLFRQGGLKTEGSRKERKGKKTQNPQSFFRASLLRILRTSWRPSREIAF